MKRDKKAKATNALADAINYLRSYESLHDVSDPTITVNWQTIYNDGEAAQHYYDTMQGLKETEIPQAVSSISQRLLAVARKAGDIKEFNRATAHMGDVWKAGASKTRIPKAVSDGLSIIRAGFRHYATSPETYADCNPLTATSTEKLKEANRGAKKHMDVATTTAASPLQAILSKLTTIYSKLSPQEQQRMGAGIVDLVADYESILQALLPDGEPTRAAAPTPRQGGRRAKKADNRSQLAI